MPFPMREKQSWYNIENCIGHAHDNKNLKKLMLKTLYKYTETFFPNPENQKMKTQQKRKRIIIYDDDDEPLKKQLILAPATVESPKILENDSVQLIKNTSASAGLAEHYDIITLVMEYLQPHEIVTLFINNCWAEIILEKIMYQTTLFIKDMGNDLTVRKVYNAQKKALVDIKPSCKNKHFRIEDVKKMIYLVDMMSAGSSSFEKLLGKVKTYLPILIRYQYLHRVTLVEKIKHKLKVPTTLNREVKDVKKSVKKQKRTEQKPLCIPKQSGWVVSQLERVMPEIKVPTVRFTEMKKMAAEYVAQKNCNKDADSVRFIIYCDSRGMPIANAQTTHAHKLTFLWEFHKGGSLAGKTGLSIDYSYPLDMTKSKPDREVVEFGIWDPRSDVLTLKEYYYRGPMGTVIHAMNDDPMNTIIAYGQFCGFCSFCGLTLSDRDSIESGYGQTCAKNYKLCYPAQNRVTVGVFIEQLPKYQGMRYMKDVKDE